MSITWAIYLEQCLSTLISFTKIKQLCNKCYDVVILVFLGVVVFIHVNK